VAVDGVFMQKIEFKRYSF